MMQFIFFDAADNRLFVRDDAETATWSVKGMQLTAEFPFVKEKEIARGMRVGFLDDDGIFQPFEVRKVKTYEPDHYQELTAEHIAIAELTDEFYQGSDATDETASAALGTILTGTVWQVGNVTASNLSSADLDKGTVWQNVRNIEANWNVWITPRVTFSDTGITGRYLDIAPAEGVWRGVTLSVNGNADEMGVTVDDSETYTAAYGMGGAVGDDSEPLDFSTAVWTETAEHPAKPEGQKYVEDPAAKALYGRNGRNRFTYYQNADIKEAELLLQKTWDYLQTVNKPKVTIECIVRDLKRMGYAGEGIRRHDLVQVRIEPVGQIVVLTVDDLEVDLLDPTATRPTIGRYIPNIVYINRETMKYASGGAGGGQTETQYEKHVFEQEIYRTERSLELEAYERQLVDGELSDELTEASAKISISAGNISSICAGVGATLDAQGHVVVDPTTGLPVFNTDNPANMYSQIKQTESGISTLVSGVSAGVFNDHTAYAKDTYVMHNNKLYRFTAAHASGPWTGVDVVEVTGLFSRIDQESDRISLVVTGTGANAQINRAGIVLSINGGTGHSQAVIEADAIDINGIVTALAAKSIEVLTLTANDATIGDATIDVYGNIAALSVTASSFPVTNGGNLVNSHIGVTATESNGQVTLTFAKADGGTPDTVTFSRASASRTVRTLTQSGGTVNVGSRVYTVDADIVYSDNGTGSSTIQIPLSIGNYDSTGKSYPLTVAGISGISVSASDAWQAGYDDGEQDMLDMYDVVSVTPGTVSKVGTASVSIPLSIEIGDDLSGNTKTVSRTVTPSVSSLLEARTGTNKITSNGTYTPSSGKLGFSTVVVDVDAGYTTPNYQCASNLTFKAGSAALTTQPTHMYALVQGNYEDMGSGYWYMRNTYMQVKTMYT
jgi:hypothetical protein